MNRSLLLLLAPCLLPNVVGVLPARSQVLPSAVVPVTTRDLTLEPIAIAADTELKPWLCRESGGDCQEVSQVPQNQPIPDQVTPQQNLPNVLPPGQSFPNQNSPNQNSPNQNFPNQNFPNQNFPNQNFPNQNFPNQNFPNQNFPNQNLPNQNFPNQTFPNQNLPNQNFPGQGFPNQTNPFGPIITNPPPLDDPYILGPGDVVQINVFDVPEYSGAYGIISDGTINLPLLGVIEVAGLTIDGLNNRLTELYRPFLVRPFINTTLQQPRPVQVLVSGEVNRPGSYILGQQSQEVTLTSALEFAGGVTLSANIRQVEIRRQRRGIEQVYVVDLFRAIQQGEQSQNVVLRDGDSVFVPTAQVVDPQETRALANTSFAPELVEPFPVVIAGAVRRPGSYTVNSGSRFRPPSVTDALASAGGINPFADIRNVRIRRLDQRGQFSVFEVDLLALLQQGDVTQNVLLQPNDAIFVPRSETLNPEETLILANNSFAPENLRIAVVGEVVRPGTQTLPAGTTLNQGILAAGGFANTRAKKTSVDLIRLNPDGSVTNRRINVDFRAGIDEEVNPILQDNDVLVVNRSSLAGTTDALVSIFNPLNIFNSILNVFDNIVDFFED